MEERLRRLLEFRWSPYLGYAGYQRPLPWVSRQPLAGLCGGRSAAGQCAALRSYIEGAVRQGGVEPPLARVL